MDGVRDSVTMAANEKHKALKLMYMTTEIPEKVQKLIPKNLKDVQKTEHPILLETLEHMVLETLEHMETSETLFALDPIFSCVLAYLYIDAHKSQVSPIIKVKARATLDRVLEKEPKNLVALCLLRQLIKTKATKEKVKIDDHSSDPLSVTNAFATIAFYLFKLSMTAASIALFEEAIETWETKGKGTEVKVVVWRYLLAGAHGQMLNKDKFTKVKSFDPDATMERIKELLHSVMKLCDGNRMLAARCYADLALTFGKYQLIGKREERIVKLDIDVPSVKHCYEQAWKTCGGKDPHVMEKYGTFLRKTANNSDSLVRASKIFEHLLRICPHRHVAAHQLALTYKALWTFDEMLEQRYLFQNKVKAGKVFKAEGQSKNARRKQKKAENAKLQQDISQLAVSITEDIAIRQIGNEKARGKLDVPVVYVDETNATSMDTNDTPYEEQEPVGTVDIKPDQMDTSETNTDDHGDKDADPGTVTTDASTDHLVSSPLSQGTSQASAPIAGEHASVQQKTSRIAGKKSGHRKKDGPIYPNMPTHQGDTPAHLNRTPDYYQRLRAANPRSNGVSSRYLKLAKRNFELANRIMKSSRVLYLVDLARVHISCMENDAALEHFERAQRALYAARGGTRHGDKTYLYEQWALLLSDLEDSGSGVSDLASPSEESDGDGNELSGERLSRIEKYFLKSINSAVYIKSKSRVAYYRLADMLEKDKSKWMTLYEIYKLVGQTKRAKDVLDDKDKTEPEVRELYKEQCDREQEYDKFLDLMRPVHAKSPDDEDLKQDIVEMTLKKMMSVSSTSSKGDGEDGDGDTTPMKTYADYGDVMKLCLKRPIAMESDEASAALDDQPSRKKQVVEADGSEVLVFMMRKGYTEKGKFIQLYNAFLSCEGVAVNVFYTNALGDLESGRPEAEQISEKIGESRIILVSDFDVGNENMFNRYVLDAMHKMHTSQVFIIQETGAELPKPWQHLPTVDMRPMNSGNLFHNVITELLQEILGKDYSHCKKM